MFMLISSTNIITETPSNASPRPLATGRRRPLLFAPPFYRVVSGSVLFYTDETRQPHWHCIEAKLSPLILSFPNHIICGQAVHFNNLKLCHVEGRAFSSTDFLFTGNYDGEEKCKPVMVRHFLNNSHSGSIRDEVGLFSWRHNSTTMDGHS